MDSFEILKNLYSEMEEKKGKEAYKYVPQLLQRVQELYEAYLAEHKPDKDKAQSSRPSMGKNLEHLIQHIITKPFEKLGLKVINGDELKGDKLTQQLDAIKRNVVIDYGKFGMHLPDADIVVYNPKSSEIIAIVSSKTSLRERIVQTVYWKFKLRENKRTDHIRVYLVTVDHKPLMRKTSKKKNSVRKARIIAEVDLDGTYVLTPEELEESDKVKLFEHFIEDFKKLIEGN